MRSGPRIRTLLGVSYIPYDPDVWPTSTTDDSRHSRVAKWVWGVVLYLLAVVAWVAWMKMPPKIEAPLALIPLPDGTELRLVHSITGPYSGIGYNATFGNRIRIREGASSWGMRDAGTNGGWMVLTQFSPNTETFAEPAIENLQIIETGAPYFLVPAQTQSTGAPYSVILFHAVPRRSPSLTLGFTFRGARQQATIANPFYVSGNPQFTPSKGATVQAAPAPLPQQLAAGGFIARVEKVTFRGKLSAGAVQSEAADPVVIVTSPHAKSSDFQMSREWHDPSGNIVTDGVLPWSEPVWGLRVKVTEGPTFPLPPERRFAIGSINAPAPGQILPLKIPREMKNEGVTDIIVIGSGDYSTVGRVVTGRAAPGGPAVSTYTMNGIPQNFGGTSPTNWEIRIFSVGRKDPEARTRIRVLSGEEICQANSTGSSAINDSRQEHLTLFRSSKSGPIPVGTPLNIEVVRPLTYTFEFQIPRPEFKRATR